MSGFYDLLLAKKMSGGGGADPGGGGSDWDDPTDGKTHIYINFPDGTPANRRYFELNFDTGTYYPLVEWGDGTSERVAASGIISHSYSNNGMFDIALSSSGQYNFKNSNFGTNQYVRRRVIGAWLDATQGLPNNFRLTEDSTRVRRLHVCGNMRDAGNNIAIASCGIEVLELEEGIQSFTASNLSQLYNLTRLTIPSTVTNMTGSSGFNRMFGLSECHLKPVAPPSLTSGAFNSFPADCKIYVPAASVEAYKTASVWSSVASYIYGE